MIGRAVVTTRGACAAMNAVNAVYARVAFSVFVWVCKAAKENDRLCKCAWMCALIFRFHSRRCLRSDMFMPLPKESGVPQQGIVQPAGVRIE